MSTSDPDPNNSETVIERALIWLLDQSTTAVGDELAGVSTRIMSAHPNPFGPSTQLRFAISAGATAEPVTLQIVDASGRLVRELAKGRMSEGVHNVVWDGSDDGGHVTPAGLYFAKLQSGDGESAFKIVRMR
jgi:flagellar hook assembly protein FlgD